MTKPLAFIVEDDPKLNQIVSLTLLTQFEIESFAEGTSAQARLKVVAPDLLVLDLNLPGVAGRDLVKFVRANKRFANTKIILTTADERQAETLSEEVDIVLLKPVSPTQLRELAERLASK